MAQDAAKLKSILSAAPVVPVIIHDDVSTARNLAEALVAGGLPNLEITLRTPNALKVMEEMAKVEGAVVGSGTVRRKKDMKASRDAGCQFMVSPGAPLALLEAAEDLGCSRLQAFWLVTVPLSKQGIIAGCFLVFIPVVGEFVIPSLLGGSGTLMIGKVLFEEFFNNRDWPVASAVAVILLLILIVPIVLFQRNEQKQREAEG